MLSSFKNLFQSLIFKRTWYIPLFIVIAFDVIPSFLTPVKRISAKDGKVVQESLITALKEKGYSEKEIQDLNNKRESRSVRIITLSTSPITILVVWGFIAGILFSGMNVFLGENVKFGHVFSLVAWTGLVGTHVGMGQVIKTVIGILKGSFLDVQTSLALLLPSHAIGEKASILYRIFCRFNIFGMLQIVLLIIGLTIISSTALKRSAGLVLSIWMLYIVVRVVIGYQMQPFLDVYLGF